MEFLYFKGHFFFSESSLDRLLVVHWHRNHVHWQGRLFLNLNFPDHSEKQGDVDEVGEPQDSFDDDDNELEGLDVDICTVDGERDDTSEAIEGEEDEVGDSEQDRFEVGGFMVEGRENEGESGDKLVCRVHEKDEPA